MRVSAVSCRVSGIINFVKSSSASDQMRSARVSILERDSHVQPGSHAFLPPYLLDVAAKWTVREID